MLQREPEGIIAGLIVLWLQRPLIPATSQTNHSQKHHYFGDSFALCVLQLGVKMSLLKSISFSRANIFLLNSSYPAKLVMWFAKRLQKHPVSPREVWVLAAFQLAVMISFYLFLNTVPI